MRRAAWTAALVLAGWLVHAAPADATLSWSAPQPVGGDSFLPKVAVDGAGDGLVAWTDATGGRLGQVHYAWRRPHGDFGPSRTAGTPGAVRSAPAIAMTPLGLATIAWSESDASVHVIRLLAGVQIGGEQVLAAPGAPGQSPGDVSLASDDQGDAVVAWVTSGPGQPSDSQVVIAQRRAGARFGPPQALAPGANIQTAAMNGAGAAVVAWSRRDGGVEATVRPPAGGFEPPRPVPQGGALVFRPLAGLDLAGDALVAGTAFIPIGNGSGGSFLSTRRATASDFGPPERLPGADFLIQLLAEPLGSSLFVTERRTPPIAFADARVRDRDGGFGAPFPIGDTPDCGVIVAQDTLGAMLAVKMVGCQSQGQQLLHVTASERAPGGVFGPESPISTPRSAAADVALNDDGVALVALQRLPDSGPLITEVLIRDDPAVPALAPPLPVVRGRTRQRVVRQRTLEVKVSCDRACAISPAALLHAGGRTAAAVPVAVPAGGPLRLRARRAVRLRLRFSRSAVAGARAELAAGGRPWASVSVTARNRGRSRRANSVTRRFSVVG